MNHESPRRIAPAAGAFDWKGTHPESLPNLVDLIVARLAAMRSERADRRRALRA
jgi:hypothetical protein